MVAGTQVAYIVHQSLLQSSQRCCRGWTKHTIGALLHHHLGAGSVSSCIVPVHRWHWILLHMAPGPGQQRSLHLHCYCWQEATVSPLQRRSQ